jgi:hypothetical protein
MLQHPRNRAAGRVENVGSESQFRSPERFKIRRNASQMIALNED